MQLILEALFEVLLAGLRYPGAFYLWALTFFRKPYRHWLYWGEGVFASIVGFFGTIVLVIILVKII